MSKILSPTQTNDILKQLGHQPNKKLGQNFLIDKNIVKKSLFLGNVKPDDIIVEIGPGLGTLSSALLESNAIVFAVEKDETLANYLTENLLPIFSSTFHLLNADALDYPIAKLPNEYCGNYKIIANLPYAIATPWLDAVLSGPLPTSMTLMLQKEAADRFCALHGSKSFGAISIFLNSSFKKINSHKVSRHCFYPEPNVDSTLLHLERLQDPFIFHPKTKELIRFFFTQRRKQIGSIIKQMPNKEALSPWINFLVDKNFSPSNRAEDLPLEIWQKLDHILPR